MHNRWKVRITGIYINSQERAKHLQNGIWWECSKTENLGESQALHVCPGHGVPDLLTNGCKTQASSVSCEELKASPPENAALENVNAWHGRFPSKR